MFTDNYTGEYILSPKEQARKDDYDSECSRLEHLSMDLQIQSHGYDVDYSLSFYYDVDHDYIIIEELNFDPGMPADLTNEYVVEQLQDKIYEHLEDEESDYLKRHDFTLTIDHKWSQKLPWEK